MRRLYHWEIEIWSGNKGLVSWLLMDQNWLRNNYARQFIRLKSGNRRFSNCFFPVVFD